MKFTQSSFIFCFLSILLLHELYPQEEKSKDSNDGDIKVIIEVYEDTAKIIVPQDLDPDVNIRIPLSFPEERFSISVPIYIDYKTETTNLGLFRLAILSPRTSLIPVNIPPPPPPPINRTLHKNVRSPIFLTKIVVDGFDISEGIYSLRFKLQICHEDDGICFIPSPLPSENLIHENESAFELYSTAPPSSLGIVGLHFDTVDSDLRFNFRVENFSPTPSNDTSKIEIYSSLDEEFDSSDILQKTLYLYGLGGGFGINYKWFRVFYNDFISSKSNSNFLIVRLDDSGTYKTATIAQYQNLTISDARIYRHYNQSIALSCTVTNTSTTTSPKSKVNFKEESSYRRDLVTKTIPSILPGESKVTTIYVSQNEYNIYIHRNTIIFSVDPDNTIKESNEDDNRKRLKALDPGGIENFVKTSPNPFGSNGINFDFATTSVNTTIKLNIYNQQGILQYHTSEFYPTKGDKTIHVSSDDIVHQGTYHYSFLFGRNDRYYSFTGTIMKQ